MNRISAHVANNLFRVLSTRGGILGVGVNQKPDFNSWEGHKTADMSTCPLHHCLWGSQGTLAHSLTERKLHLANTW